MKVAIKLRNNLSYETTRLLISSMLTQINKQAKDQEQLEEELCSANKRLKYAEKQLVSKQSVIHGLEEDLIHAIEQLNALKQNQKPTHTSDQAHQTQWMARSVPGLGSAQSF